MTAVRRVACFFMRLVEGIASHLVQLSKLPLQDSFTTRLLNPTYIMLDKSFAAFATSGAETSN